MRLVWLLVGGGLILLGGCNTARDSGHPEPQKKPTVQKLNIQAPDTHQQAADPDE